MKIAWQLPGKYFVPISLENAGIGWLISSLCAILCVICLRKGVVARLILLMPCAMELVPKNPAHLLAGSIRQLLFLLS